MQKPLEVLVFGAGAVGSTFGWRAAQKSHVAVSAICRSNYDVVKRQGLHFHTSTWGYGSLTPTRVARHAKELCGIPFDYVVCATKSNPDEQHALMSSLGSLMSKDTTLVVIQNGVEIERPFRAAFPSHTLISSICYASCAMNGSLVTQPAKIRPHAFHLGLYGHGDTDAARDRAKLETLAGLDPKFKAVPDIPTERWAKLAWNSAWNPATALFGVQTHSLLQIPAGVSLIRQLVQETRQVALTYGVVLPEDYDDDIIRMTAEVPTLSPSMLQDAKMGRHMEIETICGTLCRMAKRHGVPHPTMKAVYRILSDMNMTFKQQPPLAMAQVPSRPWPKLVE
ncbi:hypothetical protein MY10362_009679 [Beauveria mimosiformis]